jgi:hypothetical protein
MGFPAVGCSLIGGAIAGAASVFGKLFRIGFLQLPQRKEGEFISVKADALDVFKGCKECLK